MVSQNAVIAAFSSTALISLAPNVLLILFPHFASGEGPNSSFLSLWQALAAGGLLGDVFLHVVPHSLGGDSDVGLWILLGFFCFFFSDSLMRSLGDDKSDHNHKHGKKKNDEDPSSAEKKSSMVLLNLTADALHNVSKLEFYICKNF